MSDTLKHSFKTSLPVMAGYIVLGIGFGIMMADRGFARYRAALMSLTVYAGSMQYVAVDLIGSGATLIATALMTLMVNLRHFFYLISMLEKYRDGRAALYAVRPVRKGSARICDVPRPRAAVRDDGYAGRLLPARYRLCCRASRHARGGGSCLRCAAAQAEAQHAFKRYRRDRRVYDSDTRYVKELCFRFKKAELF